MPAIKINIGTKIIGDLFKATQLNEIVDVVNSNANYLNGLTSENILFIDSSVPVASIQATGTLSSSTFLRGDGTWSLVPASAVSSVFGRTGAIISANGDYTASQVSNVPSSNVLSLNVQGAIDQLGGKLLTINAGNITSGTLSPSRLPSFSGDITTSAGSSITTLATVNSNIGTFGSSTLIPVITVNGKGLITSVTTSSVSSGTVTSVNASGGTTGLNFTGGPITSSGTLTLSGTLSIANGGTGQITANSALNALLPTQAGNAGKILSTDGTNTSWIDSGAGSGTVTSVNATVPSILSVSGVPITTSGTIAISLIPQSANTIFAGPTTGSPVNPTFRALVSEDYQALTIPVGSINASGTPNSSTFLRGDGAWSSGTSSTIIGTGATGVNGTDVAIGDNSAASNNGIAIGGSNSADGGISIGISSSSENSGIAIGASSSSNAGISIGLFTGDNIASRVQIGAHTESGVVTLVNRLSMDAGGLTSFSYGTTVPTDGGSFTSFSNADGTVPQNMMGFYVTSGTPKVAVNIGGTITSYPLGDGLPSQSGHSGQYLTTNGTIASWSNLASAGTVTSVGLSAPSIFSVSGSPITTFGVLTLGLVSQSTNTFWAGPNGSSGSPTFRSIVQADLPIMTGATVSVAGVKGAVPHPNIGDNLKFLRGDGTWTSTGDLATVLSTGNTTGLNDIIISTGRKITSATNTNLTLQANGTGKVSIGDASLLFPDVDGISGQLLQTDGTGNLSWFTVSGTGTVTSVAMSVPSFLSVSGSPVTTAGTLAVSLVNQSANTALLGPTTGSAAAPSFRTFVQADFNNLVILRSGGAMLGTLSTKASTTLSAGLNLGVGLDPSSPSNGDIWLTSSSVFARIGGITYNLLTGTVPSLSSVLSVGNSTGSNDIIISSGQKITSATNTNLVLSPNGTGKLSLGQASLLFPNVDGTLNQALVTNGTGVLSWTSLGSGTVTSVALSLPSIFSVTGSPITASGTLSATLTSQAQNLIFASPDGSSGAPAFRGIVGNDIGSGVVNILSINATGTADSTTFLRGDGSWQPASATAGSLTLVLANGNTTGANDIIISSGQKITSATNSDLTLLSNGTGKLKLNANFFPSADGTVNQILTTDGLGNATWATPASSGQAPYTYVNSNITLSVNTKYLVDSTSSSITLLLPTVPTIGQLVRVFAGKGNASANNITVGGNGNTIQGSGSYVINMQYACVEFVWNGNPTGQWVTVTMG